MAKSSNVRMAIGTLAVVAIALSVDSVLRTRHEQVAARTAALAIRSQLEAFNQGNYREAFHYAAQGIQARFTLPEFRQMVESGFPRIAHSRKAVFDAPHVQGDMAIVPVTVTGVDGLTTQYIYEMQREGSSWRVAGVQEAGGPEPGMELRRGHGAPHATPGAPPGPDRKKPADAGKAGAPGARDDA
jgi:hypothetical protein